MTLPKIIRSVCLVVVVSFLGAWIGQVLLYHYHLTEAICWTTQCQEVTKEVIITLSFRIMLFGIVYFMFLFPGISIMPGSELCILLCCLIFNFIHFNNPNAYIIVIPFNVITISRYCYIKKLMNKPFGIPPFLVQEMLLFLILACSWVFLDELFVSKGLPRDIVLYTGTEKALGRMLGTIMWMIIIVHVLWLLWPMLKKKRITASTRTFLKAKL